MKIMMRIRGTIEEVMRTTFNVNNMLVHEIRLAEWKAIMREDVNSFRRYYWLERAVIRFMQKVGAKGGLCCENKIRL